MNSIDFLCCADIHLNEFINNKRRIIDLNKDIANNIEKYNELRNKNGKIHKKSINECKRIHSSLITEHNRSVLNLSAMIDLTSEMVDFYHDTSITKSPNADNIDEFIEQQNIDIIRDNVDRLCQQIARLINFIDEEYNKIYSKDDLINRQ